MMIKISILIPVLNEAETIGKLVRYLIENSSSSIISEILIIDGGSTDGSIPIVKKHISEFQNLKSANDQTSSQKTEIRLLKSAKGRAKQMNLGAKNAKGEVFYFLHADSFPPQHFDELILNEINNGHLAGCFRMQFNHKHWWLRFVSWLTQFNFKACRGGDQSLFITKALFEEIGGYDENYTVYEDNILIGQLYAKKQFVVINKKLTSSAGVYEKYGLWKVQYHYLRIHLKKYFGASSEDLSRYYKKHVH